MLSASMTVEPQWIDFNGHMNMAYYNVLFDRGLDEAFERMGIGPAYAAESNHSMYTAEIHIRYLRELKCGAEVRGTFRIVEHDEKRLHAYQELYHAEGWIAATAEVMSLHVDRAAAKVVPLPPDIVSVVDEWARAHASLPRPEGLGRAIGIRRK